MNNEVLLKIITELKSNNSDVKKLKLDNNNLKKTHIQLINSINDLKKDNENLNNKLKEYQIDIDKKIDCLSKKIKDIEEYNFKNLNQLNKGLDSISKELLDFKKELELIKNNDSYSILSNKLNELEESLIESNNDLFDAIDSLEEELGDFEDEIENKIDGILDISNVDFNDLYNSLDENSILDLSYKEDYCDIDADYNKKFKEALANKDLIEDISLENLEINTIDTNNMYIEEPKKYLAIRNLEGFYKYRDIIDLYDLESKYIFLGSENIFNNYDILLINVIKILNNKYRKELTEFIRCEENKFLYEGNPLNLSYTSEVISLREIYDDLAGEGDIYIAIPENHTEIIHSIFLVVSYIENTTEGRIEDIVFNFTFNENNNELYKERLLKKQADLCDNNEEEILDIIPIDYHERVAYYPSKKQKRKLEKLLKNSNYELKIEFSNLNRKEVTSIINILEKNSNITKDDESILFKFLKIKNNINTIDKDYFTGLVLDGYTIKELSKIFNVSENVIFNKKKEFGLINLKKSMKDSIDNKRFIELYKNGYTIKMLAKEFGVSEAVISNKKKELSLVKNYENLKDISEVKLENISYEYFTNTIPIKLYIDNTEINIENKTWVETYLKMCNYLASINEKDFIKYSSKLTSYRGGSPYFSPYQFGLKSKQLSMNNYYYAETGLNVATFINNIRCLVREMELSEDIFYIEFIDKQKE